jgi:hypothetical protein
MDDIWTIIGLSSLIAAIVSVILGIVRDVLVERYRFKKQSEARYLQSQIQIFSKIYFLLARGKMGAVGIFFKNYADSIKELNDFVEMHTDFLPPKVLTKWLNFQATLQKALDEKEPKQEEIFKKETLPIHNELLKLIVDYANTELIPKYRKIVGETVASLPED